MRTFIKSLLIPLLILLFVYAAFSKLIDFWAFRRELYRQPFPHGVSDVLLYLLPLAELAAAALLLFDRTLLAGLETSLFLLLLFTGYVGLVKLGYWEKVPCSCGGILGRMDWTAHLVFNCSFLVINLLALRFYFNDNRLFTRPVRK